MAKPETVTITLSGYDAWELKQCCANSASYWHNLWRETVNGKHPYLTPEVCLKLNERSWEFYKLLESLGAVV